METRRDACIATSDGCESCKVSLYVSRPSKKRNTLGPIAPSGAWIAASFNGHSSLRVDLLVRGPDREFYVAAAGIPWDTRGALAGINMAAVNLERYLSRH